MPSIAEFLLRGRGEMSDVQSDLRDLKTDLEVVDATEAEAKVTVDNREASAAIRESREDLARLARAVAEPNITMDKSSFDKVLGEARAALQKLDLERVTPEIQVQAAKALADIATVEAAVAALPDNKRIDIDVGRGLLGTLGGLVRQTGALVKGVDAIGGAFDEATKTAGSFTEQVRGGALAFVGRVGLSGAAQVAMYAVLIPAITAAIGAITSLIAFIANAALGLGALGLAGLAALGPIAALVLGTVNRFKQFSDVADSAAGRAKEAFGALKDVLQRAVAPAANAVLRGLADGANALKDPLGELTSEFTGLGKAAAEALRDLADKFASPRMIKGLAALIDGTSKLVGPIARGLGNFAEIFVDLANATMPALQEVVKNVSKGLNDLAKGIKPGDLQKPIQKTVNDLDKLIDFAKQAGRAIIGLFDGAKGPGQDFLEFLTDAAKNFANFAESPEGHAEIETFFHNAVVVGKVMLDLFVSLISTFADLFVNLGNITNSLAGILDVLGTLPPSFIPGLSGPVAKTAGLALRGLGAELETTGDNMKVSADQAKSLTAELGRLSPAALKAAKGASDAGDKIGNGLADALKKTEKETRKSGKTLGEAFAEGVAKQEKGSKKAGDALGNAMAKAAKKREKDAKKAGDTLGSAAGKAIKQRQRDSEKAGDALGKAMADAAKKRERDAKNAGDALGRALAQGMREQEKAAESAGDKVGRAFARAARQTREAAAEAGTAVGQAFAKALQNTEISFTISSSVFAGAIAAARAAGASAGREFANALEAAAASANPKGGGGGGGRNPSSVNRLAAPSTGGYGSFTSQAPVFNQYNSMLVPTDPRVMRTVAAASVRGIGLQPARPNKRVRF